MSELGYRLTGQRFLPSGGQVIIIDTNNIDQALEVIKEEYEGQGVVLNNESSRPEKNEYVVEITEKK